MNELNDKKPTDYQLPVNDQYGRLREIKGDGLDGWRATHGLDNNNRLPNHAPELKEWR